MQANSTRKQIPDLHPERKSTASHIFVCVQSCPALLLLSVFVWLQHCMLHV
jgi:hypothetical protein